MAIYIPSANSVIYEIPKTGTSWVRKVLETLCVEHRFLKTPNNSCDRHSPWWAYEVEKYRDVDKYTIVRHPMHWYESYWAYSVPRRDTGLQHGWHLRKRLHFDGLHVHDNYIRWVRYVLDQHPAIYTRMVESFCGPAEFPLTDVFKQENLFEDLREFLIQKVPGMDRDIINEEMKEIPPVNVSDRTLITLEERREAERLVCEMEIEVIRRFY